MSRKLTVEEKEARAWARIEAKDARDLARREAKRLARFYRKVDVWQRMQEKGIAKRDSLPKSRKAKKAFRTNPKRKLTTAQKLARANKNWRRVAAGQHIGIGTSSKKWRKLRKWQDAASKLGAPPYKHASARTQRRLAREWRNPGRGHRGHKRKKRGGSQEDRGVRSLTRITAHGYYGRHTSKSRPYYAGKVTSGRKFTPFVFRRKRRHQERRR